MRRTDQSDTHGGSAEKYSLVGNSVPWIMFNLQTKALQLSQGFSAGRTWICRNPRKAIEGLGNVIFFP